MNQDMDFFFPIYLFTYRDHYRVLIVETDSINDIQTGVHLWTPTDYESQ